VFTARFDNVRMDGSDGRGVMVWDWLLVRGAGADESARRVRSMIYFRQQADGWFIQADMYQILSR